MAVGETPQARRFEKPFSALESMFASNDPVEVVEALAKAGRGPLFQVEGLARLYQAQHPPKLGVLREQSKWLEDRVGKLVDLGLHIQFAKDVGAPLQTIEVLERERREFRDKLARKLEKKGWVGDESSIIASWRQTLQSLSWAENDREFVLDRLIELTDELRKEKWDIRELQTGLHDFRRRVRWLLIYVQALGNFVSFDGRPLPAYAEILQDPVAEGKFGQLPEGKRVKFPVLIPREVYLELTKAVDRLGMAKDMGEAKYEWLKHALYKSGAADSKKSAEKMASQMIKEHKDYVPIFKTAESVYEHVREEDKRIKDKEAQGLLLALKYRLQEQIDWTIADCRRAMRSL